MTETRKGQSTPFEAFVGHRKMTPDDATVFATAADMLVFPDIGKAITDAGGDLANIYHFSREVCAGKPILPWAVKEDHETVVAMLRKVGEGLK